MKTLTRSLLALTLISSLAGCMVTPPRVEYYPPRVVPVQVVPAYSPPPYYAPAYGGYGAYRSHGHGHRHWH
jgi:predicted small lipoprotein YifL